MAAAVMAGLAVVAVVAAAPQAPADSQAPDTGLLQDGWRHVDVTTSAGAPLSGGLGLAGFVRGGNPHVYYQSTNRHIQEVLRRANGSSRVRDITAAAGAPVPTGPVNCWHSGTLEIPESTM